ASFSRPRAATLASTLLQEIGRYVSCYPRQVFRVFLRHSAASGPFLFSPVRSCSLWRHLLPLVRRFYGREAFGSSLKGIPPKRPLVPGGASAFGVREQS